MLSKVEIIKNKLISDIRNGVFRVGEKITSRNKLCGKFNYSRTTIDRAIQELTEAGYLASRQGSSTFVISNKPIDSPQRLYIIGGWYTSKNSEDSMREMFFPEVDFSLPMFVLREDEVPTSLNRLCQPGVAVIWIAPSLESIHLMDYLAKADVPQILINRKYSDYDYVITDAKDSIKEGLSWLMIEAGRDIVFISRKANTNMPYLHERIISFYECCAELGAHLTPDSILSRDFDDVPSEIAEIGRKLFGGGKPPKGIFTMNQDLPLPLITVAQTYGYIPGRDYKLLTFDYIKGLENYTGIGMLEQQMPLLFLEAARWLLDNPHKKQKRFQKSIKTRLVIH